MKMSFKEAPFRRILCLTIIVITTATFVEGKTTPCEEKDQSERSFLEYNSGVDDSSLMSLASLSVNTAITNRATDAGSQKPDFASLQDGYTILELASIERGSEVELGDFDRVRNISHLAKLCPVAAPSWKAERRSKVIDAIQRVLYFFEKHAHMITVADVVITLSMLEDVETKWGTVLQKSTPISQLKSSVCGNQVLAKKRELCFAMTNLWKPSDKSWKSVDVLDQLGFRYRELVGIEQEVINSRLNIDCITTMYLRCEVPFICEKIFLDEVPRAQYMLSHQLVHRIFIDQLQFPSMKNVKSNKIYPEFCAKMYKEAQLIDHLGMPHILRDLFAEQIAFCGHLGYTDFFRTDWLEELLSWQSKSKYGCFLDQNTGIKTLISNDQVIKRLETDEELLADVHTQEMCKVHFTTTALGALVQYWDFLEDNCQ